MDEHPEGKNSLKEMGNSEKRNQEDDFCILKTDFCTLKMKCGKKIREKISKEINHQKTMQAQEQNWRTKLSDN